MNFKDLKIGYAPYSNDLNLPGDRRRFCYFAKRMNIKYEIANPRKQYDLLLITEAADLTIWKNYDFHSTKLIYDFIDSYSAIRKYDLKGVFRGAAKFLSRQYDGFVLNHKKLMWCRL